MVQATMSGISTDLGRSAEVFHALSEKVRLEVLEHLREGERCVCELTDTLSVAQSRLSFHLKVLKDAGLVKDRRQGRWVYYALSPEACEEALTILEGLKPRSPEQAA